MPIVTIKAKYQVTLPTSVRRQAGLSVGDILDARVEGKKITLTPKRVVDRELALALEEARKGRVIGPFNSAEEMLAHLRKRGARRQRGPSLKPLRP
jgi:AbrB family looped-hinge helix DNA binding protein